MLIQQESVKAYVEQRLATLGIGKAEACRRCFISEELLDKFLTDAASLTCGEFLKVVIMFGSVLESPTELARACGVDVADVN